MAITDLGTVNAGGAATADQSTFMISSAADCAAGEFVVVVVVADNNAYPGPLARDEVTPFLNPYNVASVTFGSETLDFLVGAIPAPGDAAQTCATVGIYGKTLTSAKPAGTYVTVTYTVPGVADHTAVVVRHFTAPTGLSYSNTTSTYPQTTDPGSLNVSAVTGRTYLCIRAIGVRNDPATGVPGIVSTSGWTLWPSPTSNQAAGWRLYAIAEHIIAAAVANAAAPSDPTVTPPGINTSAYVALYETPITGTLAATEGSDSASFGDGIVGWLEAYEGEQPITADSTLYTADNDIIRVDTLPIKGDSASFSGTVVTSNNGTLSATEARDTASFTGLVAAVGSLAATEAPDIAAFAGRVEWFGSLAAQETTTDTASFAGTVTYPAITGTLIGIELAGDTAAFTGSVAHLLTLAATEGADTASFVGNIISGVGGPLVATEAPDTAAFAGSVAWTGALAATEGADIAVFAGLISDKIGTLAATEAPDVASFSGLAGSLGGLAATEASDHASFDAYLSLVDEKHGVLDAYEDQIASYTEPHADSTLVTADDTLFHVSLDYYGKDLAHFVGEVTAGAQLVAVEGSDTANFVGSVSITGVLGATEGTGDTAAFEGAVASVITGQLAAQEDPDIAAFKGARFWELVGIGEGEAGGERIDWLDCPKRQTFLKNEVGRIESLTNPKPRVIFLRNEQARIDDLAEAA